MTAARTIKPSIPSYGEDGVAIRHEIELEPRFGTAGGVPPRTA